MTFSNHLLFPSLLNTFDTVCALLNAQNVTLALCVKRLFCILNKGPGTF